MIWLSCFPTKTWMPILCFICETGISSLMMVIDCMICTKMPLLWIFNAGQRTLFYDSFDRSHLILWVGQSTLQKSLNKLLLQRNQPRLWCETDEGFTSFSSFDVFQSSFISNWYFSLSVVRQKKEDDAAKFSVLHRKLQSKVAFEEW